MSDNNRERKWRRILEDWKKSGLIRIEYCRKNNLKLSTFDYWNSKIKKKSEKEIDTTSVSQLVKVTTSLPLIDSSLILEIPGGYKLSIPFQVDTSQIIPILRAIKEGLK